MQTKISSIVQLAIDLQAEIDNSSVTVQPNPILWHGESKYFPIKSDVACKCGCEQDIVHNFLYNKLVQAREIAQVPFIILSWNRCEAHNAAIKGSKTSSHLKGLAIDIGITTSEGRYEILRALILVGFTRIGIYDWGIHVDVDLDKPAGVAWLDL